MFYSFLCIFAYSSGHPNCFTIIRMLGCKLQKPFARKPHLASKGGNAIKFGCIPSVTAATSHGVSLQRRLGASKGNGVGHMKPQQQAAHSLRRARNWCHKITMWHHYPREILSIVFIIHMIFLYVVTAFGSLVAALNSILSGLTFPLVYSDPCLLFWISAPTCFGPQPCLIPLDRMGPGTQLHGACPLLDGM